MEIEFLYENVCFWGFFMKNVFSCRLSLKNVYFREIYTKSVFSKDFHVNCRSNSCQMFVRSEFSVENMLFWRNFHGKSSFSENCQSNNIFIEDFHIKHRFFQETSLKITLLWSFRGKDDLFNTLPYNLTSVFIKKKFMKKSNSFAMETVFTSKLLL